jgi:hypothetical protein
VASSMEPGHHAGDALWTRAWTVAQLYLHWIPRDRRRFVRRFLLTSGSLFHLHFLHFHSIIVSGFHVLVPPYLMVSLNFQ